MRGERVARRYYKKLFLYISSESSRVLYSRLPSLRGLPRNDDVAPITSRRCSRPDEVQWLSSSRAIDLIKRHNRFFLAVLTMAAQCESA